MSFNKSFLGVGVFAAIGSALCCITPVLAMLGGISGIAATFSWVEPARPYLIGLTVLALGFAWFQKIKPPGEIDCVCDDEKTNFWQGKLFLGLITGFAILMLTFPLYSSVFYRPKELPAIKQSVNEIIPTAENKGEFANVVFVVDGMTCSGCELEIQNEVSKIDGISEVKVSYKDKNTVVTFDKKKTSVEQIKKAIDSTGYKVKGTEIK